jgi:hypothetical protein
MAGNQDSNKSKLAVFVASLRQEFDGDEELVKQGLADINALERQNQQHALEARIEYARQIGESNRERETALKEYGMQTLKWAFVMNAGAAGLLLGYIGTRIGVSNTSIQTYLPLVKATIPFAVGCILVTIAGLAAWANFSYASQALPSVESMFNFFNISKTPSEWPRPKGAPIEADLKVFFSEIGKKLDCSGGLLLRAGLDQSFALLSELARYSI